MFTTKLLYTFFIIDRIAMSVGRVRFMPPSPSGGLYPDLSLIENDDKNNLVENQVIGCKVLLVLISFVTYLLYDLCHEINMFRGAMMAVML